MMAPRTARTVLVAPDRLAALAVVVVALLGTESAQGQTFRQEDQLEPAAAAAADQFGSSVDISGLTAIVGSPLDSTSGGTRAGSATVFVLTAGSWSEEQSLEAQDAAAEDRFGIRVAIDGDTAVVGADHDATNAGTRAGSAYVFVRSGSTWTQQQKLEASDAAPLALFGRSVAVDDDTVVVGAPGADSDRGAAYVFVRNGVVWTEEQKLEANDGDAGDQLGMSVAVLGDDTVVGAALADGNASRSGAAYFYTRSSGSWTQEQKLEANDGAANDEFGWSVGMAVDTVVIGANWDTHSAGSSAGSAYVFSRAAGSWTQDQKLIAGDATAGDMFGMAVSIDGNTVVVGAPGADAPTLSDAGAAYVFARDATSWSQEDKLEASDSGAGDEFGKAVDLDGDHALVGAPKHDTVSGTAAGSAYVFGPTLPSVPAPFASATAVGLLGLALAAIGAARQHIRSREPPTTG